MTEDQSEQPESIVLLLRQAKRLDVHLLSEVLQHVTGWPFRTIDGDTPSDQKNRNEPAGSFWVAGGSPHFIIQANGVTYLVHNASSPYCDTAEEAAEEVQELRLRRAIRDHRAWLSMDVLHPEQANSETYRIIVGVLARFSDSDCLAVYHPPSNRFTFSLRGKGAAQQAPDPVGALFEMEDNVPVLPIDDDPRLEAAEQEARRRSPEFEKAFRAKAGLHFAVKTSLSGNGNREHLWVTVQDIEEGKIKGTVGNDPVDLGDWKFGSPVEVAISDIEDWLFVRKRFERKPVPVGGFTLPVPCTNPTRALLITQ
jgi:uncharacterized protein YegJ (DUF2314 family)